MFVHHSSRTGIQFSLAELKCSKIVFHNHLPVWLRELATNGDDNHQLIVYGASSCNGGILRNSKKIQS